MTDVNEGSQRSGGVKDAGQTESPRALQMFLKTLKVSRSGVIPGPTVKVRMGESNDQVGHTAHSRYFFAVL